MEQEKIGKFISKLRKENNMTQEELALKMGVTSKSISRWENGKTMPDISMLSILAEELNCTVQELLNGRKMTKEELVELKETIDKLIEYQTNQQIKNDKTTNKYCLIGYGALLLALLNSAFGYLNYIFTPNMVEFIQGALYGICICANMISLYNRSHNISIRKKKKEFIKIKKKIGYNLPKSTSGLYKKLVIFDRIPKEGGKL